MEPGPAGANVDAALTRWAASGAMALTGLPEQPLGPPAALVDGVGRIGRRFDVDALALLGERAALMGLWRRGATSCGGSCRLLRSADGFIAVSLPRAEDIEAVPAWLELDVVPTSLPATWSQVEVRLAERGSAEVVERARLLGLPVCTVGEVGASPAVAVTALGEAPVRDRAHGLLVVDLSALWAGPLCGDLLAGAGAAVVKVESTARPDGARRGPAQFFDLLNGRKRSVALNLAETEGVRLLHRLVQRADVVIEASRPRALRQLGIGAADVVRAGGPQVWVSITGYGRTGASGDRVAFGDDAAAAGGLVAWNGAAPLFCADAVGDPLTGLTAADACLDALARGGRWLLDVSMAGVCAAMAGPALPVPPDTEAAAPRARAVVGTAPAMGADTAAVLEELGLTPEG